MNTFHQLPILELRPFVDRLWGWESVSQEVIPLPTLLPGTGAELYFHYGEPFRIETQGNRPYAADRGHLFCVRRAPVSLLPASGIGFVAVRFKIGMLHRFASIPADELADCHLSAEDIWGRMGTCLSRNLSYAIEHEERIALIQRFLVSHLKPESADLLVERAMTLLYRQWSALSIEALACTLGLGRRQLERRWKIFSGQSPSEVKGLIRFQQTVRGLMLDPSANTTDLALACGYFDQAHFIRDFRHRTGLPPQRYLRIAHAKTHFYNTPLRRIGILATPN